MGWEPAGLGGNGGTGRPFFVPGRLEKKLRGGLRVGSPAEGPEVRLERGTFGLEAAPAALRASEGTETPVPLPSAGHHSGQAAPGDGGGWGEISSHPRSPRAAPDPPAPCTHRSVPALRRPTVRCGAVRERRRRCCGQSRSPGGGAVVPAAAAAALGRTPARPRRFPPPPPTAPPPARGAALGASLRALSVRAEPERLWSRRPPRPPV